MCLRHFNSVSTGKPGTHASCLPAHDGSARSRQPQQLQPCGETHLPSCLPRHWLNPASGVAAHVRNRRPRAAAPAAQAPHAPLASRCCRVTAPALQACWPAPAASSPDTVGFPRPRHPKPAAPHCLRPRCRCRRLRPGSPLLPLRHPRVLSLLPHLRRRCCPPCWRQSLTPVRRSVGWRPEGGRGSASLLNPSLGFVGLAAGLEQCRQRQWRGSERPPQQQPGRPGSSKRGKSLSKRAAFGGDEAIKNSGYRGTAVVPQTHALLKDPCLAPHVLPHMPFFFWLTPLGRYTHTPVPVIHACKRVCECECAHTYLGDDGGKPSLRYAHCWRRQRHGRQRGEWAGRDVRRCIQPTHRCACVAGLGP